MVKHTLKVFENYLIHPNITAEDVDGVCDIDGNIVEESLRILNENTKRTKFDLRDKIIKYENREVIFLGNFFDHYGHFILETLSCFWVFFKYDESFFENKKLIFIESVNKNGSNDIFKHKMFLEVVQLLNLHHLQFALQRFDIIQYKKVYVPAKIFRINDNFFGPKIYNLLINTISLAVNNMIRTPRYNIIYVSRNCNRRIKNEDEVKDLMNSLNIKIINPNIDEFKENIYIYNHAKIMIGIEGTNVHNSIFMKPNNCNLIHISGNRYFDETKDFITKNQILCCKVRNCKLHTINDVCDENNIFDVNKIEMKLKRILKYLAKS